MKRLVVAGRIEPRGTQAIRAGWTVVDVEWASELTGEADAEYRDLASRARTVRDTPELRPAS